MKLLIRSLFFVLGILLLGVGSALGQGVVFKQALGNNGNGTVINQAIPTHANGDLLIMHLTTKGNPDISSISAGWISLTTVTSGANTRSFVYYKFTSGSEPNVNVQITTGLNWAVQVLSYSNASNPNFSVFSTNTGTGGTQTTNSLTTAVDSARLLVLYGFASNAGNHTLNNPITAPTNMTFRDYQERNAGGNNKIGAYAADQLIPEATSVGTRGITASVDPLTWTAIAISIRPVTSVLPPPSEEIIYAYQSGNWNEPLSWTRDPSGTTLIPEAGILPVTGDSVVILNGRIINLTADVTTEGLGLRIAGGGVLNLATFQFTQALRSFSGTGRLRSSRTTGGVTYMPTVASTNRFIGINGGITEYYCQTNVTLNNAVSTYFSLELSLKVSGTVTYTLAHNLTLHGDLIISRTGSASPTLTFGGSSSRSLNISRNMLVEAGANFRIATNNQAHNVNLNGDLVNNGSVRFLNNTSPDYLNEPTNGYATITFGGLSDNKVDCFGETNFYRLVLDKGSDATYILTINSSNVNNFRLLGRNNQSNNPAQNPSNGKPDIFKALTLNHGTLRLKENIEIPSLSEGGDDIWVRSTACLWVDGATVYTTETANGTSYQAITVTGRVLVSAGLLDTRNAAGIIYTIDGIVEIRGGNIRACQMRSTGGGQTAYIQTGGTVVIDGVGENATGTPRFQLTSAASSFTMSGGLFDVRNPNSTANGGFDLNVNVVNGNVTGGTIRFGTTGATDFEFRSTVPFFNLEASRVGSPSGIIQQNSASISVLNNFSTLNGQTYNCNNNNLVVGGNFSIETGTIFIPGTNTLTLNGSARQLFTYSGTISGNLNNLTINKSADTLVMAGTQASLIVANNFSFLAGSLRDAGKVLELRGDVVMSGKHFGTGEILLTTSNSRTISGNGQGRFQNLSLSGGAAHVLYNVTTALRIGGVLNFIDNGSFRRVFSIGANNLLLEGAASINNANEVRFIRTNGLQSAGGVTKEYNSTSFNFPVGTTDSWKYTPALISFNVAPTTYGRITVRPVNAQQPAVTANGKALQYYWRVTGADFVLGPAQVTKVFTYVNADAPANQANYVPAYIDFADIVWTVGATSAVDEVNNTITFSGVNFNNKISGEFTAGDNSAPSPFGAITVYYSRTNNGAWNDVNTWTTNADHTTNAPPATPPGGNSIVRIGNGTINHTILVTANGALSGNLVIASGSTLDLQGFTGNNFGSIAGETIAGNGLLRINKNGGSTYDFPGGDFGDFLSQNGGEVEYYNTSADPVSLPAVTAYRNLSFNAAAGGNILLPITAIEVFDTLKIRSTGSGILRTSEANTAGGSLVVGKDFKVVSGVFEMASPGGSGARVITIQGMLQVDAGATFRMQGSVTTTHTINVLGDIVNNGTLNLRSADGNQRANLQLNGNQSTVLTGTATLTRLAGLLINKGQGRSLVLELNVTGTLETLGTGWLDIQNGTFRYNRTGNLTIHNSTTTPYEILETAAISINNGTVFIGSGNTDNSDLVLRGLLEITGGTVNIGDPINTTVNNDIIVAAAGTPEINIMGGSLRINGQLRRDLLSQAGALRYIQGGNSTVRIVGRNPEVSRGMIEVVNSGSYFQMGGTSELIINRGGSVNFADLYVRPEESEVTGGTVRLTPTDAPGNQVYKFDVTYSFYNLEIVQDQSKSATVELNVNNLIVNNNLTLDATATLNCNNLNVSVGRKFLKQGTYNGGTNTLRFFGTASEIEGEFTSQNIHNLRVSQNAVLTLVNTTSLRIVNTLFIEAGATLNDNGRLIDLKANVDNLGTHTSPTNASTNTLQFTGNDVQEVSGNGAFGNFVINNSAGVYLKGPMTINRQLTLTLGLLDIGEHQLTLGLNAPAVSGSFSDGRMIRTNGVLSDGGVVKLFPASAASYFWPIGVFQKYTPATINLTSNSATGSIQIRPVNTKHPSTREAANLQLNYFWQVDTIGFASVVATHQYNYLQADVTGTESNYRAGRYIFPNWAPIGGINGAVNTSNNTIDLVGVNYLSGGFTAGEEAEFAAVATYYSRNATNGGNWTSPASWSTDGHDGDAASDAPEGAPVIIASGHTITVTNNTRLAESMQLNGTAILDLTNTFAHNFGVVTGTGTIRIRATAGEQFVFPGGNYDDFTSVSGGTVEFYNSDPGILPTQTVYNKVILKDAAARTQPDVNYIVNGLWTIEGGSLSNNTFGRNIEIRNNWLNQVGASAYLPGTGTIIFNSANAQTITGVTSFYNIRFNGGGSKTLNDSISVFNQLVLNHGRVYLGNNNLYMDSVSSTAGNPADSAMVVQNGSGRIIKRVRGGQPTFTFPIGEETGTAEYSPATIVFTTGDFTLDATVRVQVVDGDAPECGSGANFITRYWSWNQQGISNFTATVTGTYTDADVEGTEAQISARMSQNGPCINGQAANTSLNRLSITTSELNIFTGGEAPLDTPTISATFLVFSNVTGNSMTISWTRGNGSGRIVLVKQASAVDATPVNGTTYAADADFSDSPDEIGSGNFVAYLGNDSVFTLSGLQSETTYHVAIFEFNNGGVERVFKQGNPLIGSRSTLAAEPSQAASDIGFSVIGVANLTISWDNGNGAGRLVLMKAGSAVDEAPEDGVSYAANSVFGQGAELGTGNYVVATTDSDAVVVTGLDQNTRYYVQVFEYNGSEGASNFLVTNAPEANQHTWLRLQMNVWLEGPYNTISGKMLTNLTGIIPTVHPYSGGPWNFGAYSNIQQLPSGELVDWVMLEIRMSSTAANAGSATIKGRALAFINENGELLDTAGNLGVVVPTDSNGQFYAAIYHRTHIPVMTATMPTAPVDQENGSYTYDFTDAQSKAYGTEALAEVGSNIWALYAGRVENTTPFVIDTPDRDFSWEERNKLGYEPADAALEGLVDATDRTLSWNNRQRSSQIPE
ncbi:MAG: hypothetical protein ACK417_04795 [Bacteroidia bacterium]